MAQQDLNPLLEVHPAGTIRTVTLVHGCAFQFVWCPPGNGVVGSSFADAPTIEQPCQPIRLTQGFWIARTPVTRTQWQEIAGQLPQAPESLANSDEHPVSGITWDDARNFCSHLSDRLRVDGVISSDAHVDLPYEAEWEYACRAGTTQRWFFGDDQAMLEEYAWYRVNSNGQTHRAGGRKPNPWGLFDLYGNVAEWCRDTFRRYGSMEVVDPHDLNDHGLMKAVRGGDFAAGADECRSAARAFSDRDNDYNEPTGLRPVVRQAVPR
ncbi:formylglycine-generating enzyme family protein [Paraburkholderia aromaticivorans]|uniref:formylglycine-generating enzyme family protein n=1 Tax=Paraburkholderia aromaticivorans TaxID=2026199 RepID=UPI00145624E2|nr:formylglycine-generating enzyme family protein [Paraburkholderia aromaticivorans]